MRHQVLGDHQLVGYKWPSGDEVDKVNVKPHGAGII